MQRLVTAAVEGRLDRIEGDWVFGLEARQPPDTRMSVGFEMTAENRQAERVQRSVFRLGVLLERHEALVPEGSTERVAGKMAYRLVNVVVALAEGESQAGPPRCRFRAVPEIDVLV